MTNIERTGENEKSVGSLKRRTLVGSFRKTQLLLGAHGNELSNKLVVSAYTVGSLKRRTLVGNFYSTFRLWSKVYRLSRRTLLALSSGKL